MYHVQMFLNSVAFFFVFALSLSLSYSVAVNFVCRLIWKLVLTFRFRIYITQWTPWRLFSRQTCGIGWIQSNHSIEMDVKLSKWIQAFSNCQNVQRTSTCLKNHVRITESKVQYSFQVKERRQENRHRTSKAATLRNICSIYIYMW